MSGAGMSGAGAPLPAGLASQERAARTLQHALAKRTTHAFMLSGSPGTGTHEAALWIARAVLCPAHGCAGCDVCRRVDRRVHPDLLWVEAEGVQLREAQLERLVEQLVRLPFEAQAQVAVIADADTLAATNVVAANKLLKVLEEPPGDVVFVLLASTPDTVLPTIRSRVIEVAFPPLANDSMRAYLEGAQLAHGARELDTLVALARGDMRRARDFATGGPASERHELVTRLAAEMAGGGAQPATIAAELLAVCVGARDAAVAAAEREFATAREMMPRDEANRLKNARDAEGHEARARRRGRRAMSQTMRALLDELAVWYRDLLATSVGAADTVSFVDCRDDYERLSPTPTAANAVAGLDALDELAARIPTNVDLGTALAALCAELVGLSEGRLRSRRTVGPPLA